MAGRIIPYYTTEPGFTFTTVAGNYTRKDKTIWASMKRFVWTWECENGWPITEQTLSLYPSSVHPLYSNRQTEPPPPASDKNSARDAFLTVDSLDKGFYVLILCRQPGNLTRTANVLIDHEPRLGTLPYMSLKVTYINLPQGPITGTDPKPAAMLRLWTAVGSDRQVSSKDMAQPNTDPPPNSKAAP